MTRSRPSFYYLNMKNLVLDLGGVLLSEPMDDIFTYLAREGGVDREDIIRFYYDDVHDDFWTGGIDEEEFWGELLLFSRVEEEPGSMSERFLENLESQAPSTLRTWQEYGQIHILSNHRSAWAEEGLDDIGREAFSEVWISEEIGAAKPNPEAFAALLGLPGEVLFVDDKESNIKAAAEQGISGLVADDDGLWVFDVSQWLGLPLPD